MVRAAYVHIPFCSQICNYCDFNKFFIQRQPVDEYLRAMEQEIIHTIEGIPPEKMKSIFIGGGTPTALTEEQLIYLLSMLNRHFQPTEETEFTIEANPDDITLKKLEILQKYGVNRMSYGVQSFDTELLHRLGRTHTEEHIFQTIEKTKAAGFTNISVDLMYGLPNQTISQWKETLEKAFSLDIQHFSAYSLIVEPKTVFYIEMNKGKLSLPEQEEEAWMYEFLMTEMEAHGYHQYEISNFAKPRFESKHNLTYWNNDEYYGIGAGAHGYIAGKRTGNIGHVQRYIHAVAENKLPYLNIHEVTKEEAMGEEMFLGLRRMSGVDSNYFQAKFNQSVNHVFGNELEELVREGLLAKENGIVRLTKKGKLLGNDVFAKFV